MEFPLDELLDKTSIWKLKAERVGDVVSKSNYDVFLYELNKYNYKKEWLNKLYEINAVTWDLESDIRKCYDDKLSLEEIGRRTILIRENNKVRVAYRNMIVNETGWGFNDVKVNTLCEEDKNGR